MKCLVCKEKTNKRINEYFTDIIKINRSSLLCTDCNNNRVWTKNFTPSSNLNTRLNYLECEVFPYNIYIKEFIDNIINHDDLLCELIFVDGSSQLFFPYKYCNNFIYGYNDIWKEGLLDTPHTPDNIIQRIPLYKLRLLKQRCIYDDYIESDPAEPMYGYKAMLVEDGKISDGYEIGITKTVPKRSNSYKYNYQECYLHFCAKMEEPLLIWDRDYISDSIKDSKCPCYHLYRVKAEGHYRQNTTHGWVANTLTLLEEVTREDIITYYKQEPELIDQLKKYWGNNFNSIWYNYLSLDKKSV